MSGRMSRNKGKAINLVIHGEPVAQPRQRQTMGGRNYTPAKHPVNAMKAQIRIQAGENHAGELIDGPVSIQADFYFPRSKGQIWKRKPMPRLWHTKKPDGDNLIKAVKDALSGVIYTDDSRVCDARYRKHICSGDEKPRIEIEIQELEQ